MAYATSHKDLTNSWQLITDKVSLIQLRERAEMIVNGGVTPLASDIGFEMGYGEKYANTTSANTIWIRMFESTKIVNLGKVIILEDNGI